MGKLNIPTPTPAKFDFKIFGAKPVPYQPQQVKTGGFPRPHTPSFPTESSVKFPAPYNPKYNAFDNGEGLLLSGISAAEQLIASFLSRMPEGPLIKQEPRYEIPPAPTNTMQSVGGTTLSGTALLSNIEFAGASYTDFSGQTKGFDSLTFNTVLISVKQHKNVVETNIQGSDAGSIFEYSGMGSYDITINILVVGSNQNGVYPQSAGNDEDGVEDIIKMLESPIAIKVHNWYLQMLNIFEIVIMDYEIGQIEGGISQQPITIIAKSSKKSSLVVQKNTTG